MNNDKPLTGVRKRQQIETTNKQIILWASIASSLVVICVVIAINFIQDITYQIKVNSALSQTASSLSTSVNNISSLSRSVINLSTDHNLTLSNLNSYVDSDGDSQNIPAQQVVLYAMPTSDDPVALGVMLQGILAPVRGNVSQIGVGTGSGTSSATTSTNATSTSASSTEGSAEASSAASGTTDLPTPQPETFSITLSGNPNDGTIRNVVQILENTSRVIVINSLTVSSTQTTIQATAYYTPRVNYQVGTQEVKP